MKYFLSLLFSVLFINSFGADISGIINQYSKVISSGNCLSSIKIENPELFYEGEEVILMQMQGAIINESNSSSYGTINDLNTTGSYEKAIIEAISNDTIFLTQDLINEFDYSKSVQIISYPKYDNATISSTLTCKNWNGKTGGVLAFQVTGTTTFDAGIDVTGKGFRGGEKLEISGNSCTWLAASASYYYPNNSWEGSSKGEGIAIISSGKEFGKGAQANGGGGGNDHNSGGAGGGNYNTGGIGGENDDPSVFACRGYNPGIGGLALNYTSNHAFLGGGGGAGHGNNNLSSAGGNGGGIMIFSSASITGSSQQIIAKGNDATQTGGGDGAGGGGAGGTVLLNVSELGNNLSIDVSGGKGGNVDDEFYNRCHGPGGGGSGGFVNSTNSTSGVSITLNGGEPGVIINSIADCNLTSSNAQKGGDGSISVGLTIPQGSEYSFCIITSSDRIHKTNSKIFHNPSWNSFNWQSFEDVKTINVYDNAGRLIEVISPNQLTFGNNYSKGIYFIHVQSQNSTQIHKIVKK